MDGGGGISEKEVKGGGGRAGTGRMSAWRREDMLSAVRNFLLRVFSEASALELKTFHCAKFWAQNVTKTDFPQNFPQGEHLLTSASSFRTPGPATVPSHKCCIPLLVKAGPNRTRQSLASTGSALAVACDILLSSRLPHKCRYPPVCLPPPQESFEAIFCLEDR